jgi:hypothetical protein
MYLPYIYFHCSNRSVSQDKRSVAGRYRHPAIMAAIKTLLFPQVARGRPVGVRFMEKMVLDTPAAVVQEFRDKTATSGAPVPLLALACTMVSHLLDSIFPIHIFLQVFYGLHAILAGDWSQRKASGAHKPVQFTERRYGSQYRSFVKRLKDYHRLGELRTFHMEAIMYVH